MTIDGDDITEKVVDFSADISVNQIYNTATLSVAGVNPDVWNRKDILVEYGDATFTGFVFGNKKTGRDTHSIQLRSDAAKLTEPFTSSTTVVDAATTSKTLVALYEAQYGVTIIHTCADIDFGGSYNRTGTPLDALRNVAAITGADYYDSAAGLIIEPSTGVSVGTVEITEDEYFNFLATENTIFNKGISTITITSGTDSSVEEDIVSDARIYAELDEYTGDLWIFSNPTGKLSSYKGMIFPSGTEVIEQMDKSDIITASGDQIYTLNGAIVSISSVTVNGTPVSNYGFKPGHNKIWFNTKIFGNLAINYIAYYSKALATTTSTPDGNYMQAEMFYKNQYLIIQGFIQSNNSGAWDGNGGCIMPDSLNYVQGFDFRTVGGSPQVEFYQDASPLSQTVVSVPETFVYKETARLSNVGGGNYQASPRFTMLSDNGSKSYGVDIAYTIVDDAFQFDRYYPEVVILYKIEAIKHTVQFDNIPASIITMSVVDSVSGERCDNELQGADPTDPRTMPCALPASFVLDLVSLLGCDVASAAGQDITNIDLGTFTADQFGEVLLNISAGRSDGEYEFNTEHIQPRTKLTFILNICDGGCTE